MRQFTVQITRQASLPEGRIAAEIAGPPAACAPGQFFLAETGGLVRVPVFPEARPDGGWQFELPAALAALQPGDSLDLLGPCGRAQRVAEGALNILLVAGEAGLGRLRPLAQAALAEGAAVALLGLSPQPLHGLAPEVEVRYGAAALPEALEWAGAVYADLNPAERADLAGQRGARPLGRNARLFQLPPAPCGVGACGACAVSTSRGWQLACTEGPWFDGLE